MVPKMQVITPKLWPLDLYWGTQQPTSDRCYKGGWIETYKWLHCWCPMHSGWEFHITGDQESKYCSWCLGTSQEQNGPQKYNLQIQCSSSCSLGFLVKHQQPSSVDSSSSPSCSCSGSSDGTALVWRGTGLGVTGEVGESGCVLHSLVVGLGENGWLYSSPPQPVVHYQV